MSTTDMTMTTTATTRIQLPILPVAFIVLWSSGYIGGALGVRYAEPFTLMFARFSIAAIIFLAVAIYIKAPWPERWQAYAHAVVVGILLQVIQFGGLYTGIGHGVPAGQAALIVGMMPIFVLLGASRWLGEKLSWHDAPGSILGVGGVAIVVWSSVGHSSASLSAYLAVCVALCGITTGTIYQKRFLQGINLWVGCFVQMVVGSTLMLLLAWKTETMHIKAALPFAGAVAWVALMNSVGALALLYEMIRRGEASKATNLFHVIPAVTAIMASLVLREIPSGTAIVGFLVSGSGVYLMNRRHRK